MSLISLDYVRKTSGVGRGARTILDDVSVEIGAGEFVTMFDPSGATSIELMEVIAGLTEVDDGNVVVGETDLTRADNADRKAVLAAQVGILYPSGNLLPALTVGANVDLPRQLTGSGGQTPDRARIVEMFAIADIASYYPDAIPPVARQRAAIAARVLAGRKILLCTEPTAKLHQSEAVEIVALLRMCVRELGLTVVTFTANPLLAEYADRVYILANGRVAGELIDPTLHSVFTALQAIHGEV